jgi:hypothetical protein
VIKHDLNTKGTLWSHLTSQVQSYPELRSLAQEAYVPPSTADAILQAYNLTPQTPLPDLHASLLQFATVAEFGLPVHLARKSLASSTILPGEMRSKTQAYRIQNNNPFRGPLQLLSHYCVDLLYLFDAFHHDLGGTVPVNQLLVDTMQALWIDFISDGCAEATSTCSVGEDEMTVYGRDPRVRKMKLQAGSEFVERERRFDVLERDRHATGRLWQVLCGRSVSMRR